MNEAPRRARCDVCGGPIYRPAAFPGVPSVPAEYWLHGRADDWRTSPHDARPALEAGD